jgi:hypothetical protein
VRRRIFISRRLQWGKIRYLHAHVAAAKARGVKALLRARMGTQSTEVAHCRGRMCALNMRFAMGNRRDR